MEEVASDLNNDSYEGVRAVLVEPKDLFSVWDRVAEFLGPACDFSGGRETLGTLRNSLLTGADYLFVVLDGRDIIGAVTYNVTDFKTGLRLLDIPMAGGVAMETQIDTVMEMIENLRRNFMCDRVTVTGRRGWVKRLAEYGFKQNMHTVETI
jgi:hypothetical protein